MRHALFPPPHFDSLSSLRLSLMKEILCKVKSAFAKGIGPKRLEENSDVYLLRDVDEKPIALFKTQKALQECTAHLIDYEAFAGVPPSIITTLSHPALGGYVLDGRTIGCCQVFYGKIPLQKEKIIDSSCIRRIALLDMRTLNQGRYAGSILLSEELPIPTNHQNCFPEHFHSSIFNWAAWEAAKTPFSSEEKSYIFNLNPEKERLFLLQKIGLSEKAANLHFLALHILQEGLRQGLSAYQLSFFYRPPQNIFPTPANLPKELPAFSLLKCKQSKPSEEALAEIKETMAQFADLWRFA